MRVATLIGMSKQYQAIKVRGPRDASPGAIGTRDGSWTVETPNGTYYRETERQAMQMARLQGEAHGLPVTVAC